MISLKLNGRCVSCPPGTTLLQLARREGINIPTLCHLPGRPARAVCRLCVVEVAGHERLHPACATPAAADMEVHTHSARCVQARQLLLEFIIAEHGALDTLSPELRSYAAELGVSTARFDLARPPQSGDKGSDYIRYRAELCLHCDRCIAACEHRVIRRAGRGAGVRLTFGADDAALGQSECTGCGDCVAVCPSGALGEWG